MEIKKVNVLIIDQQVVFRKGIVYILENFPQSFSISELSGFEDLGTQPLPETPVLLIASLDNYIPLQFKKTLGKLDTVFPKASLLFYSRENLSWMIDFVGSRQAAGYLSGVFDEVELNIAVTKVLEQKRHVGYDALWEHVRSLGAIPVSQSKKHMLSRVEREIADLLLQGKSITEIARMTARKTSTISTIKSHIFKKKNVTNLVEFVKIMESQI